LQIAHIAYPYADPYSVAEDKKDIDAQVAEIIAVGQAYYGAESGVFHARPAKPSFDNPATRLLAELTPLFREWLGLMPTAKALYAIQNLGEGVLLPGQPLDDFIRKWFANLDVALGIRARSAIEREVTAREINRLDRQVNILSLACGEARTVIGVAAESKIKPKLTLLDLDNDSLISASAYAAKRKVNVTALCRDVVHLKGFQRELISSVVGRSVIKKALQPLSFTKLTPRSFDVVTCVGFLEYLKPEDWYFEYHKVTGGNGNVIKAGAERFLRNAFEMVAPGGVLLIGNINLNGKDSNEHPHLRFLTDCIQWARLQPRTEDEFLNVVEKSGIQANGLTIYKTPEGLYNLYEIRKGR
jgi:2-polyprenyl-3-methyl-5-hydroxy-6-metoxy-1,4-benzoquinol methylase